MRPALGYEDGYTFGNYHYGPMLSGKHTGDGTTLRGMSTLSDFKLMRYQPHRSGAGNALGVFSGRAQGQPMRGVGLRVPLPPDLPPNRSISGGTGRDEAHSLKHGNIGNRYVTALDGTGRNGLVMV